MKSLKAALWICAIGCLAAVPFMVLPWATTRAIMVYFGVDSAPDIPVLVYSFRITCGVFGLIGIYFIILARNPLAYGPMLNLGAYGLLTFGLLALILGLSLEVNPLVFIGDALSGIVLGSIIAFLSSRARRASKPTEPSGIYR